MEIYKQVTPMQREEHSSLRADDPISKQQYKIVNNNSTMEKRLNSFGQQPKRVDSAAGKNNQT